MKKSAFTMLELVFVIVVIGILSAVFIPKFGQNKLSEAANQLIAHIRYTQHLAMIDDQYNANDASWYEKRWQIVFGTSAYTGGNLAYTIFSDISLTGQADINEIAKNPLDKSKLLSGGYSGTLYTSDSQATSQLNLGQKYGIVDFHLTGGSTGSSAYRVVFDHLGRPYRADISTTTSPQNRLATSKIYIKLCRSNCIGSNSTINSTEEAVIVIEPETGYVHLL